MRYVLATAIGFLIGVGLIVALNVGEASSVRLGDGRTLLLSQAWGNTGGTSDSESIVNLRGGKGGQCPEVLIPGVAGCVDTDGDEIAETPQGCLSVNWNGTPAYGYSYTIPEGKTLLITDIVNTGADEVGGLWTDARGLVLRLPPNSSYMLTRPFVVHEGETLCPLFRPGTAQGVLVTGTLVPSSSVSPIIVPAVGLLSLGLLAGGLGAAMALRRRTRNRS